MKRIVFLMLILLLTFGLCACAADTTAGTNKTAPTSSDLPSAATSHCTTATESTDTTITESTDAAITESTDVPTAATQHTHSFRAATCTEPQTCACGTTEGSANGHNWKDATCSEPKTCTVCGTTSGLTADHDFSDGKCTLCGKEASDNAQETTVWIPTKGGTKYHTHPGCSNMIDPEEVTQSQAESRGFTPCKRCY